MVDSIRCDVEDMMGESKSLEGLEAALAARREVITGPYDA